MSHVCTHASGMVPCLLQHRVTWAWFVHPAPLCSLTSTPVLPVPLPTRRYEALKFIPCFDQPDLKARLALSVGAPAHWTVVGNEIGTSSEPQGEGDAARRLWTFKRTPLLSTYLFAVVAGPYICKRDTYKGASHACARVVGTMCRRVGGEC